MSLPVLLRASAALYLLLIVTACEQSPPANALPASTWFPLQVGTTELEAQLAVRPAEMARGLMFRRQLGADQGMLFVYRAPQRMSFWMKNTELPLDIGFFDPEGTLLEVRQLEPHNETPVPSSSSNVQFALEMHEGWFARQGLEPGAVLSLSAVKQALEARGFETEKFLP